MIGNGACHDGVCSIRSRGPGDKPVGRHKEAMTRAQNDINEFQIIDEWCIFGGKLGGDTVYPGGR